MSDGNPVPKERSPTGLPAGNGASLDIRGSQVDKIIQVIGSQNVTVNEAPKAEPQSWTASATIILGGLALLAALAFSPSGRSYGGSTVFVGGGALAMIVFGFFSWVECLLKPSVRLEIGASLVGVRVGKKMEAWPDTFAKLFERVFGKSHLSRRCFAMSAITSVGMSTTVTLILWLVSGHSFGLAEMNSISLFMFWVVLMSVVPDYVSLMFTRATLIAMNKNSSPFLWTALLTLGAVLSISVSFLAIKGSNMIIGEDGSFYPHYDGLYDIQMHLRGFSRLLRNLANGYVFESNWYWLTRPFVDEYGRMVFKSSGQLIAIRPAAVFFFGSLFSSCWLWLYAGARFLLKVARRFDIGFQWFNRRFDIEKRPLQSIGLVAGALVALLYWAAVTVSRVV